MSEENGHPKPAEDNGDGRDPGNGRFLAGNRAGKGNPLNRKAQQLRNALLAAVTEEDMREALEIVKSIMRDKSAKASERLQAIGELFDRCIGKPMPADIQQDIDDLRQQISEIVALRGGSHHA